MKEVIKNLSQKQLDFIHSELGYDKEHLDAMSEDEFYDNVYDKCCDIEVETTCEAGDGELSERGKIAESLVTVLGNSIEDVEEYLEEE